MKTLWATDNQHWFFRYKLYHIPFWCLYHYIWWTVAVGNPMKAAESIIFFPNSLRYIFYVLFEAAAVYFNLYYLLPKYFDKGRYSMYAFVVSVTIFCTALLIVAGYYLSADITGKTLKELYGDGSNCFYYFFGYALPSAFASMTLAMTIKLAKNRIIQDRRHNEIAKETLETELKFLKHQFNPHFLFNSINSIFVLIRKNPERASAALAKFSELLRHQLYECNEQQVSLSKEITHLRNFIELEKLRQNAYLKTAVHIEEFYADHLDIAPFILMTFVENAFKHVCSDTETNNYISIRLGMEGNILELLVSNSRADGFRAGSGGIGLKNVQRRLELLYPLQHQLTISSTDKNYEVKLRLNLKETAAVPLMKIV